MDTLPDYLCSGLDIVFVGINPGAYSAQVGHYFATPRNRFWAALNGSGLVQAGKLLGPADDEQMNGYGIGFTDLVKRPSSSASNLQAAEYRQGAPALREKLLQHVPMVVCFNGMTSYRNYLRYTDRVGAAPEWGPQEYRIGRSRVFVVPNPSPANAAYSLAVLTGWYRSLGEYLDRVKRGLE